MPAERVKVVPNTSSSVPKTTSSADEDHAALAAQQGAERDLHGDHRHHPRDSTPVDQAVAEVHHPPRVLHDVAVVRGEDEGGLLHLVDRLHQLDDLVPGGAVQVGRRLVGEDDEGLGHQGAGDGHALALPAGKLVGLVLQPVGQSSTSSTKRMTIFSRSLRVRDRLQQEGELDVLVDVQHRDQVEGLEDEPDLRCGGSG